MAKHYNRKFVQDIILPLRKNGFICDTLRGNKNKYIIKKDGIETIVHSGMSCYHPLRRWLKNNHDFNLENL